VMFSPSSSFCFPPFFSFVSFSATCDVLPPSPFSLFYLFFPVRYLNFYFGYNSFLILYFSPSKLWSSLQPCARIIQHSPWRPYMIWPPLSLVELKIWFKTTSFLFLLLYCSFSCCYMPVCVVFIRLKKLAIVL
jgi:hypothetical protein